MLFLFNSTLFYHALDDLTFNDNLRMINRHIGRVNGTQELVEPLSKFHVDIHPSWPSCSILSSCSSAARLVPSVRLPTHLTLEYGFENVLKCLGEGKQCIDL
jgi:hypothetical protein